eukprot:scaffold47558_cov71-Phaeocystis_antarctica.AAC.1
MAKLACSRRPAAAAAVAVRKGEVVALDVYARLCGDDGGGSEAQSDGVYTGTRAVDTGCCRTWRYTYKARGV